MGEGDSEGIWDAAMGEMTRWVLHMGRWISLERASWKGGDRFGWLEGEKMIFVQNSDSKKYRGILFHF